MTLQGRERTRHFNDLDHVRSNLLQECLVWAKGFAHLSAHFFRCTLPVCPIKSLVVGSCSWTAEMRFFCFSLLLTSGHVTIFRPNNGKSNRTADSRRAAVGSWRDLRTHSHHRDKNHKKRAQRTTTNNTQHNNDNNFHYSPMFAYTNKT